MTFGPNYCAPLQISVIRSGKATVLTRRPYYRIDDDGLGMAPLHHNTERGPLQHGTTYVSTRLDERTIQLVVGIRGRNDRDFWDRRAELLSVFAPNPDLSSPYLGLRYDLPNSTRRQIDVLFAGDMTLGLKDRQQLVRGEQWQPVGIQLLAPDPTWYDPTLKTTTFGTGSVIGSGLNIPWPVPWGIGASTINQTTTIAYAGSWLEYPRIRIIGPITAPLVRNITTGEVLSFPNLTVAVGDFIEVDTRYGYKTVTDSFGINKISSLSDDSDLATFHLAVGNNTINVQGTAATGVTSVQVLYFDRFVGI